MGHPVSKKPPKDTSKGKRLSFPATGKGKDKSTRTGRAAPKRGSKMAKPPREDEDLFKDETEKIREEHAQRVAEADAEDGAADIELRPLNPRQRAFAEHYIKLGNATKAYRAAGYEGSTPEAFENSACRLLGHVGVRKYIGELLDDCASPRIADARERHEFLTDVMRGRVRRKSSFYGEQTIVHADVAEGIKAAELLAKINGELTEKREIKGDVVVRVIRGNSAPSAIGEKVAEDD